MPNDRSSTITKVRGLTVGQAEHPRDRTGVTAVLFPRAARVVVEVRGGAPAAIGTEGLGPYGVFGLVGALFLSGGSLYGLDAARGIRRHILGHGGGVHVFGARPKVVGVAGSILFDLPRKANLRADYEELGFQAARAASRAPVASGSRGAGRGASVGKLLGRDRAMQGGLGSAARRIPRGGWVGAIAAVNSVGNVVDPSSGRTIAGARGPDGHFVEGLEAFGVTGPRRAPAPSRGTNLVIVATDHPLTRRELGRVAWAAHDGIARAVRPAHTSTDGDTVYVASTAPEPDGPVWPRGGPEPYPGATSDLIGLLAAETVVDAIGRAVHEADGSPGLPAVHDLARVGRAGAPAPRRSR